jgi:glyoxylase-like metal-dependent hydrolase (beta-lactamase superfamily II)
VTDAAVPLVLGDVEITTVIATRFALDGGAMFGVVPKPAWSRAHPSDADNRIALVARVLVVTNRRAGYRALIDAGLGDAWSERERGLYGLDGVPLLDALAGAGIEPASITDVVLTHLHWDHAGGLATRSPDPAAPPVAALPDARLHVGRAHLEYAARAVAKDRGSFRPTEMALAQSPGTNLLDEGEVLPGLYARRSDGHTHGLLVIEAHGDGQRVVFPADLLPLRAHARPAWGMAYDNFPLTVVEEKTRLVESCARDGGIVVLEHDPGIAAMRVDVDGEKWTTAVAVELRDAGATGPA